MSKKYRYMNTPPGQFGQFADACGDAEQTDSVMDGKYAVWVGSIGPFIIRWDDDERKFLRHYLKEVV